MLEDTTYLYGFFTPDGTYVGIGDIEEDMGRFLGEQFGIDAELCLRANLVEYLDDNLSNLKGEIYDVSWGAVCTIDEIRALMCCDDPDIDMVKKHLSEIEKKLEKIMDLTF